MMSLRTAVRLICLACLLASVSSAMLRAQETTPFPAGVELPKHGSMFGVTVSDKGVQFTQLHASEIVHNGHAASNLARSFVYAGPHASVELDGINAGTHLSDGQLSFLAKLSDEETDLMRSRLTLIRLQQTEKRRVVSTFSQNVFGGQRKRVYDIIPVRKVDLPEGEWVRLIPEKPLEPGEYGVILMPRDATLFPDAVYDFDVKIEAAAPIGEPHRS